MEQYISEAVMLILGAFLGWFPNRKKQKVDTKQIEVQVLENALQVLNKDVVEPLRENQRLLLEDYNKLSIQFKKLQHAISQMYKCRTLDSCPIRFELQKHEGVDRKGYDNRPTAYRARDSTRRENNKGDNDSSDNSDTDTDRGAD